MMLLVAEIVRPEYASGQLLEKLAEQWASLCWRHLAQSRGGVRKGALLRPQSSPRRPFPAPDSALIPFPTAILSAAIQGGNEFDARVAVALYAAIAVRCACHGSLYFMF
jgi:hypothetical protein